MFFGKIILVQDQQHEERINNPKVAITFVLPRRGPQTVGVQNEGG